jgi:quercetin 2,3-dioxygenase
MVRQAHLRDAGVASPPRQLAPIVIRRDVEIHRTNPGPYHARLHFSFGDYQDPAHMGIGALHVLNHEVHPPAARLHPCPHTHEQRVTHVVAGTLRHVDSVLESGWLEPGGVQRMTLAQRADYLEWNPSPVDSLEIIDIWFGLSRRPVLRTEQRQYHLDDRRNRWLCIARPHGESGSGVAVDSDAGVLVAHLDPQRSIDHLIAPGHGGYLYVIAGEAAVNTRTLCAGDAALVVGAGPVIVEAAAPTELMLVVTAV